MDDNQDQPVVEDKVQEQIDALTTNRITQDQIVSGAIKPRHLMTSTTSTAGSVPMSNGSSFQPSSLAAFSPFMIGQSKYKAIFGGNLPIGDNDLYTVPTGKKLLLLGAANGFTNAYNPSAGSITYYGEIKVSGIYYRIKTSLLLTTGQSATNALIQCPMVLNAGESISVNTTTTAGLNIWASGIEFDANNSAVVGARILNLSNGNNTLYTTTTGKTGLVIGMLLVPIAGSGGSLAISNTSGGSLNYYNNYVPSGSTASSANQIRAASTVLNNTVDTNTFAIAGVFSAGDSLTVNTSGGGAGQMAWTSVFEI